MAITADHELTDEQQRAAQAAGRPLRIVGAAGTGKTTTLLARYRHLLKTLPASAVLVLCRTRDAADRLLSSLLPDLAGGFDALPVTTFHGLAFDAVTRHQGHLELITGAEQRRQVAALLAAEGQAEWPTLHPMLGRRAFVAQVAAALTRLQVCLVPDDAVRARAGAAGAADEWDELLRFKARYQAELTAREATDGAGLLVRAAALLERAGGTPFRHVLVDDYEAPTPAMDLLLERLASLGATVTVAGNPEAAAVRPEHDTEFLGAFMAGIDAAEVVLTRPFRHPSPGELVHCTHPAVEPEAVAGVLLAAQREGVGWRDMAVLVRRSGDRARAVARALARHNIPVAPIAGPLEHEPTVAAVIDMLRWVAGDEAALDRVLASPVAALDPSEVRAVRREAAASETSLEAHPRLGDLVQLRDDLRSRLSTDTPAALAFEVWRRTLGSLATGDDRALDALVSFCDGLARRADRDPDERLPGYLAATAADDGDLDAEPWRSTVARSTEVVTVTSIENALGRQWHTVVVAGCVEGEIPRLHAPPRLFDVELLDERADPRALPGPAERRRRALVRERRLFAAAQATATARVVATAAPEPGVLLSRFVEGWPTREPQLPLAPGPDLRALPPTPGQAPIAADGRLDLSASQLASYDDCPLRYSYRYLLGARDEAGVHADLGSLVHGVLADFLDPDEPCGFPHTKDGLLALAEGRWRDDIARYRPQVEEARRDYFAMLESWWDSEGGQAELAPEVLSVERRFEVEVGPHRLRGAIDRIDRADDGSGIRIVDYKTGKVEPTGEKVADDLQLAVYHLAATRDSDLVGLGPPTQLRLLYLRTMHCFEQEVAADHEQVTEARVLERADAILAERFDPSVEANCRTCSYQRLCPLHDEGRQLA